MTRPSILLAQINRLLPVILPAASYENDNTPEILINAITNSDVLTAQWIDIPLNITQVEYDIKHLIRKSKTV